LLSIPGGQAVGPEGSAARDGTSTTALRTDRLDRETLGDCPLPWQTRRSTKMAVVVAGAVALLSAAF
jgi:hypothetical protein